MKTYYAVIIYSMAGRADMYTAVPGCSGRPLLYLGVVLSPPDSSFGPRAIRFSQLVPSKKR